MESQSFQQQQPEDNSGAIGVGGSGGASKSSFLCRQSSSRWIPTTDQIRILRDLYYNCGVRSPNADQIQRISARLRQYGKIEGKNVFYWFQNHKARERQKKRLTVDIAAGKYNNGMLSPGVSPACTSPGVYCVGQVGGNGCGGSVLMERNYMEYSLPGGLSGGSMVEGNMGWVGVEPTAMPPLYHHQQRPPYFYEQQQQQLLYHSEQQQQQQGGGGGGGGGEDEEAEAVAHPQIETLPLFPIHSEPQRREGEDRDGRNSHANSLHRWAGKAHPPHSGHFPATFYLDQPQHDQLRQQEEDDQRPYMGYVDDKSINIGGASLELSLYSYGAVLPHGPT